MSALNVPWLRLIRKHSISQKVKAFKNLEMSAPGEVITESLLLISTSVKPLQRYFWSFRSMRQHKSF